jgi:hypothetical protein
MEQWLDKLTGICRYLPTRYSGEVHHSFGVNSQTPSTEWMVRYVPSDDAVTRL